MRICIVNIKTGLVENISEMGDGAAQPTAAPDGYLWIESPEGGIGWVYENGTLTAPAAPAESSAQLQHDIENAIQGVLDDQAKAHGYDDLRSAISYRGSSNPTWAHEGDAFFTWRDAVWAKAIAVMADVMAGKIKLPTPDEAVAMMPALSI